MLISLCIPCGNRAHDLKRTLPYTIDAAAYSPPVEIVILDYNSRDDLAEYMQSVFRMPIYADIQIVYRKYTGRDTFHKAHAFNLAILASHGEYAALLGADAYPNLGYVAALRELIEDGCIWMRGPDLKGIVCIQRQEFIDAGGYDERFEYYGPEDRDLDERLQRRCRKFGLVPKGLMRVLRTPDSEKTENFRIKADKHTMSRMMRPIYDENRENGVLIANADREWGRWNP